MNRGVLQSSPVQQMMAGNPNWWSINSMRPPTHQQGASPFLPPPPPTTFFPQFTPTSSSTSSSSSSCWHDNQELPAESWSQLLFGGLVGQEEKDGIGQFHVQPKKLENWLEEQALPQASNATSVVDVKQENSASSYAYGHAKEDFHHQATKPAWSHQIIAAASSPKSCVTSFSSNMLDFSGNKLADTRQPPVSECNSTPTDGTLKKARFQPSATQSTFKVRKEKLGDRITALHQLVSPFGKTDTASVLLEAIGYIRFLQSQIEVLSLPYMGSGSGNMSLPQQQSVQGERNSIFPDDPGQLLNENCMKRKGGPDQLVKS
ncbi:transcription factor bHLH68-like isoform X2 [Durio zibethinus]|uniref:Transcription factor bHLH68-like isoform X2 n=1 Tax=Durio zibethinus TaxID=66656 RepID=A0A6P5ZFZ6_DURZI|nr:transcription factor bHLH68-like isoform X2 [Durio zibethinus]